MHNLFWPKYWCKIVPWTLKCIKHESHCYLQQITIFWWHNDFVPIEGQGIRYRSLVFQKVWFIFLIAQNMWRKLSWKRDFEIVLCLESADSNCTAVSKGGKIQNAKLRIEQHIFWTMEIIPIFFWWYRTFS